MAFPSSYDWPPEEVSFVYPQFLSVIGDVTGKRVLDVGCGTGWIARDLASSAAFVLGFDPSQELLDRAERPLPANLALECFSAHEIPPSESFDLVVSSFTIHLIKPFDNFVNSLRALVEAGTKDARFVFLVPHPCFIDRNARTYSKYIVPANFSYLAESDYSVNLRVGLEWISFDSHTYPLERYIEAFTSAGLRLTRIHEPSPVSDDFIWTTEKQFPNLIIFELVKER
jgi:SAM-dependent methyltransferase